MKLRNKLIKCLKRLFCLTELGGISYLFSLSKEVLLEGVQRCVRFWVFLNCFTGRPWILLYTVRLTDKFDVRKNTGLKNEEKPEITKMT